MSIPAGIPVDHPSSFIQDELDARGWTLDDLAHRMGGEFGINRLALDMYFQVGPFDPNMIIGQQDAQRIALAFGVSPEFFLNLEAAWRRTHPDTKEIQ